LRGTRIESKSGMSDITLLHSNHLEFKCYTLNSAFSHFFTIMLRAICPLDTVSFTKSWRATHLDSNVHWLQCLLQSPGGSHILIQMFPGCSILHKVLHGGSLILIQMFPGCSILHKVLQGGSHILIQMFPGCSILHKVLEGGSHILIQKFPSCSVFYKVSHLDSNCPWLQCLLQSPG